ncbi:MAG: radical SAM family heme chaperone HemW [Eubacteriales bacterium]
MKKLGLYIHIPFCQSKCNYCDFTSFSGFGEDDFRKYAHAVLKEINWYSEGGFKADTMIFEPRNYLVDTIFIGGGTPSLFPLYLLEEIKEEIYKNFHISENLEFTIESNPKTLTRDSLRGYRDISINRLSMGVQSFDDDILHRLGRIHNADDIKRNYAMIRDAGFNNVNLDLMFGIPGQSFDSWKSSIREVIKLSPEHLSIYGLKIEEGTPFSKMLESGEFNETDDEMHLNMYHYAMAQLTRDYSINNKINNDYLHYEISNLAKMGFECRHNLKYWSMDEYLGIGLNAHSYVNHTRSSNISQLDNYIENSKSFRTWEYVNNPQDEISEYIFTGMRKTSGIRLDAFKKTFGKDLDELYKKEIKKLQDDGLLESVNGNLRLTRRGMDISNYVLSNFV